MTDPSDEQQLAYWKELAEQYKANWEACQEELEDFQQSSRELEAEMETQLDSQERKISELQAANQKLSSELDTLKAKYSSLQLESREQMTALESKLQIAVQERDLAQGYIRELEQLNDDLERAKRSLDMSLEDFEKRMNQAIERNAFLESELDEKDVLVTSVHRLKEETRELKQELAVREKHKKPHSAVQNGIVDRPQIPLLLKDSAISANLMNGSLPSSKPNKTSLAVDTKVGLSSAASVPVANDHLSGRVVAASPLTPSSRISALNIVGDLLRKVGALESKLANCRKFVVDGSNTESPTKLGSKIPQLCSPARLTKPVS